jgi:GNAT superfamily N-acetyltransferase
MERMAVAGSGRNADLDARILAFGARHFGKNLRPATAADLPAMARIHAHSGTPGLLSDVGETFLRDVYYAGLLASPLGDALVVDIDGTIAGFTTFSLDSDRLFSDIFRKRLLATAVAVAKASIRRPKVGLHFAQTVLTIRRSEAGADIGPETVSLEVAPEFQRLGLGFLLFQAGVDALTKAGATRIKSRVLVDNPAVERLHPPLGFVRGEVFRLHGRDWVLWTLDVTADGLAKG